MSFSGVFLPYYSKQSLKFEPHVLQSIIQRRLIKANFSDGESPLNSITKRDRNHWEKNNKLSKACLHLGSINKMSHTWLYLEGFLMTSMGWYFFSLIPELWFSCAWSFPACECLTSGCLSLPLQNLHTYLDPISLCPVCILSTFCLCVSLSQSSGPWPWCCGTLPSTEWVVRCATLKFLFITVMVPNFIIDLLLKE